MLTAHAGETIPHHIGVHAYAEDRADELLLLACRRFCGENGHDKLRPDQLRTAFYQLIDSVDDHCKREMCDLLAEREDTPRAIAHYLALEHVDVGGKMLLQSPVLGQLDLLRIAHAGGATHAAQIAKRADLGPALQRQLGIVPQQTSETPTVQENDARTALLAAASRKTRLQKPATKADEPFADRLEMAAWRNQTAAIVELLCEETKITRDAALAVMNDQTGDTLAVAMKSLSIEPAQAHRIAMYTFPQIGLDVSNALRAMAFYERQDVASCQQAVSQWPKVAETKVEPQDRRRAADGVRTIGGNISRNLEARPTFGRRKSYG